MKQDKNEELISIITAVAAAALGYKVKVKTINFLDPNRGNSGGWSLLGRINVLNSHNVNIKGN